MTEPEILQAIANDELVFYYQPKVSLVTGKVVGAEALLRWIRADGTMVLPGDFLPFAEASGLITHISRHMFGKFMKDLVLLRDMQKLTLSFNASALDFTTPEFAEQVVSMMDAANVPMESVQIELTETVTLSTDPAIKDNILRLRNAGVGLAMDDFGKGYSSIDTLSQWPFTTIKLDQGLVDRMLDSEKNRTIVDSAIRMAHELGINVIAEGVETDAQYQHLLSAGCTKVQGFWIGQGLSLDKFIQFLQKDIRWSGVPVGLIHMANLDHMQWRVQLLDEVVKASVLPADSIHRKAMKVPPLSCKECRLGLWYYGAGQAFAERASFQRIEQPHQKFHEIAQRLLREVSEGASTEAITPLMRDLSETSLEVMRELHALESEGLRELHMEHLQQRAR